MVEKIGYSVLIRFAIFSHINSILLATLKNLIQYLINRRVAVKNVMHRQIYFTGIEASRIIITIAILIGIGIVTQITSLVGNNGALTGKILVWIIMRELAPLLTAIIIIARSGTAIAAEIGNMKLNGELNSLESMGISIDTYLIFPRIVGLTISVLILTTYFIIFSFSASFITASIGWHITFEQFTNGLISAINLRELFIVAAKALFFGLYISATCCSFGLSVTSSSTEIPQAATKGVISSLFAIFIVDGIVSYLASFIG